MISRIVLCRINVSIKVTGKRLMCGFLFQVGNNVVLFGKCVCFTSSEKFGVGVHPYPI